MMKKRLRIASHRITKAACAALTFALPMRRLSSSTNDSTACKAHWLQTHRLCDKVKQSRK